jgi:hypothetical protein
MQNENDVDCAFDPSPPSNFSHHFHSLNASAFFLNRFSPGIASLSAPTNIPMSREGNNTRRRVQAIRPVYSTSKPTTPAAATDPDVIHIAVHSGDAGKEILYWEDIVFAFKDALNIRHGADILSFVKGSVDYSCIFTCK